MSCAGQARFHFLIFLQNVIQQIALKLSKKYCFLFWIGQHCHFFKGRLERIARIALKSLKKGLVFLGGNPPQIIII